MVFCSVNYFLCRDIAFQMSRASFLPCDEADSSGLQERDLRNSQIGAILKNILLDCEIIKISQKSKVR